MSQRQYSVSLDEDDAANAKRLADEEGIPFSTFVQRAMNREVGRVAGQRWQAFLGSPEGEEIRRWRSAKRGRQAQRWRATAQQA